MWSIHTMGCYSAIKRNEVRIHATIWINLENFMLSERSQTQKTTYWINPFIWNVHNRQIYRDRNSPELGGLKGNREWQLMGTGFLWAVMKMFSNWLWQQLHKSVKILKTTELYTLNGWIGCYVSYISINFLLKTHLVICTLWLEKRTQVEKKFKV